MRIPLSWLAEFVSDLPQPEVLSERLTMAGLEVDAVERTAVDRMRETLVVARLDEARQHPNADRLTLCTVNDGAEQRQIVCGAKNMKPGDHVVLAQPGTVLPGGMKIKKGKLRGEVSAGMLCSAGELGLPEGEDGILILGQDIAPGTKVVDLLGLDDTILDIAITPNRGDCLSVRGLAREVAAVCELELLDAWTRNPRLPSAGGEVAVHIEAPERCLHYRGVQVINVAVGPSPAWLQQRLAACGIRSINNVVDVTNYVLLEYGQPLHAFDQKRLSGSEIFVREAGSVASMATLDDTTVDLLPDDLLICDAEGPVALAGVMGGAGSAVEAETTDLFLEAAVFDPSGVRRTSRRLGLITDSSYRFERGVDATMLEEALARAAKLVAELSGGTVAEKSSVAGAEIEARTPITLRPGRVTDMLAAEVATDDMQNMLTRLGAQVTLTDGQLSVVPPGHRHDLSREIDLLEEVARLRGYDQVATEFPRIAMSASELPPGVLAARVVREQLLADGLSECVGLAFASQDANERFPGLHPDGASAIDVVNPLRSDVAQMRRSALAHLTDAQIANRRNGRATTDLFTTARTFSDSDGTTLELEVVAGLLSGPRRSRGPGDEGEASFGDVKGVLERTIQSLAPRIELRWVPEAGRPEYHPRESASVWVGDKRLGYAGVLHPNVAEDLEIVEKVALFEVDSLLALEYAPPHAGFGAIGKFPSSSRDISFLVPRDMLAGEVIDVIAGLKEKLIESVNVFDEYTGEGIAEGSKALAFQVKYRSIEKTLTESEVAALHTTVVDAVTSRLGLQVRM